MASAHGSLRSFWKEYKQHRIGIAGLSLLVVLLGLSALAITTIPIQTFAEWHNPEYWRRYPKAASPSWTNNFLQLKLPEHLIMNDPEVRKLQAGQLTLISHYYSFNFTADAFPDDFMLSYVAKYGGSAPLVEVSFNRPDGEKIVVSRSTPPPNPKPTETYTYSGTIYSTDRTVKGSIAHHLSTVYRLSISADEVIPPTLLFSKKPFSPKPASSQVLNGPYAVNASFLLFDKSDEVLGTELILGGQVYGIFGTDDLRRDLFIGIIWGTPVALFIGLSVAILSVMVGVVYGLTSGYYGKRIDESMMRVNDVIYALPALPFLIILTVSIGRSILYVIVYLIVFGWVGVAKVARSIALQLKKAGYVEAAEVIGASKPRIMFRHIMPQIAPYALASIALSVPSAILTEAGLSFLGLGDPTLPTWGQILHDAQLYGAAARGIWWWIIPPGMMVALTGLTFVLIGTALDTIFNPKMRRA